MNTLRNLSISLFILFNVCHSFGQDGAEIGFYISNWRTEQIALDFRKPIADKTQFTIGVSAGFHDKKINLGVREWTETLHITRQQNNVNRDVNLKVGLTYTIKESPFYVGANLMAGYQN